MTSRINTSTAIIMGIIMLMALACADQGDPPTGSGNMVSFSGEVQDTLMARCALSGCHGLGSMQSGFTMGNVTWNEIRNGSGNHGPVIVPGDASSSNLFMKTTLNPPFGSRMPNDGTILSLQAQIVIRDWINQGALDN